jgi:hypothetical protein
MQSSGWVRFWWPLASLPAVSLAAAAAPQDTGLNPFISPPDMPSLQGLMRTISSGEAAVLPATPEGISTADQAAAAGSGSAGDEVCRNPAMLLLLAGMSRCHACGAANAYRHLHRATCCLPERFHRLPTFLCYSLMCCAVLCCVCSRRLPLARREAPGSHSTALQAQAPQMAQATGSS